MLESQILVIEPRSRLHLLDWRELAEYRDLLAFLTWRDLSIRYKQSVLGYAWAFLQPFVQVVVFSVVFGLLLGVQSGDVPYPLFALTGVIAWTYFSNAVQGSANSLVAQQAVVTKVYFPRLLVPLTPCLAYLLDLLIAFLLTLAVVIIWTGGLPMNVLWLPLHVLLMVAATVGAGALLAAVNVRYRDVRQITGLLLQLGMYLTPVIWPLARIQEKFPHYYWLIGINPLASVIQGFRAGLLGMESPAWPMLLTSIISSLALLLLGLWYFHRTEDVIADIV
jgi:lipopolysaccharide transport system permease protein